MGRKGSPSELHGSDCFFSPTTGAYSSASCCSGETSSASGHASAGHQHRE